MRGFLITGDEAFLTPYTISHAKSAAAMESLTGLVEDNAMQVERLRQIAALQVQWSKYASEAIALRRNGGDVINLAKSGRGKLITDEIREIFDQFFIAEQRLLADRSSSAQRVTQFGVAIYLGISLLLAAILAWLGRRDLMSLSNAFGSVIDKQREHAEMLERQAWLRTGQTALAESNLGQQGLARVGRASLDFIAEYTGAAVGALYARDEDGSLRRIAGYGVSAQESSSEEIINGRNLVTQALNARRCWCSVNCRTIT